MALRPSPPQYCNMLQRAASAQALAILCPVQAVRLLSIDAHQRRPVDAVDVAAVAIVPAAA